MKNKYIPHRDILYINIVSPNNDQKIMQIPRAFLLGGKHKFENGGRLTDKYTYIPKRNVKLIVLTDDTEIKDFSNGFWVDNKILDKKYSATKSDEQIAIEFLTNAKDKYLSEKTTAAKKVFKLQMIDPIVMDGLRESLKTQSTKLMDLLIELYHEFISKLNAEPQRPLAMLLNDEGDFENAKKVMDIVQDKYLSLNYKIKPIAIARTKQLEEQDALLKLMNSFTMRVDASDRPLVAIKAYNGSVVATDAHTLLHVILPGEKSDKLIKVSKEAQKSKIDKPYPDISFLIGINSKEFGQTVIVNKSDLKLLIDHINAVIENGLTSAPALLVLLNMPNNEMIGFNPILLLKSLSAMVAIGHDRVQINYATRTKPIIITPADIGKDKFSQADCSVCMPIMYTYRDFSNYFYWDIKTAKAITITQHKEYSEDNKFEKGGHIDGQMELFDEDIDTESMYALGGDVPVSDPLEHDQLYTIYNVKTGTDKHSAIVAQEVIDIVKTDAGQDAENINTLEEARVYLEQNGYILDELEPEFALGGGLADNMSVSDIAKLHNVSKEDIEYQLKKGIQVEMEHTGNRMTAREIAMDHLVESPEYYTLLENMEQQFAKGGKIGFKALAKKVSNAYVGKPVPAQYRGLYGKTYSKQEADKVGNKVAAKVYRQQLNK